MSEFFETFSGNLSFYRFMNYSGETMVSEITIRRKLNKFGTITSYNKNGMFYTLPHIPKFDVNGLLYRKDVRFSKQG